MNRWDQLAPEMFDTEVAAASAADARRLAARRDEAASTLFPELLLPEPAPRARPACPAADGDQTPLFGDDLS